TFKRWIDDQVLLPLNPYKKNSPVILVPKSFLNVLPEINSDDFSETMQLAERLRNDFNYEVDRNLDKEKIAQIAIENYDLVKEYIEIVEKRDAPNFGKLMKKTLRYVWYELSKKIVSDGKFDFGIVTDENIFLKKIDEFVNYFKDFIEIRSGYK